MGSEMQPADGLVNQRSSPLSYALLLFMGIAWGLAISLAKLAVSHGGHPVGLALWQVSTSGSLLLFLSFIIGPRRRRVTGALVISRDTGRIRVHRATAVGGQALSSPRAIFFGDLSMFLCQTVNFDSYQPSYRPSWFGLITNEMTVSPHA